MIPTEISPYFKDGKLTQLPKKLKKKQLVFVYLIGQFEEGKAYTEKEVNEILKAFNPDFAMIRRYLVDYGYLERDSYGTNYRVKEATQTEE